jgi:alkylation response protein AidB-like acyl-CoA dehydrogenase
MFEQGVGSNLSLLKSKAVAKGGEYVLNGEKLFVTMPDNATFIMSVFPTDDGITIFLVDGKSEGLSFIPLRTLDKQRLGIMSFQNVRVPKERVIGKSGEGAGIIQILNKAKAISCAEMIGGAEVALETAINYSKQRITFGRPIGSNQVLQHKMVDMMLAIEKAKCITYHVAWLNSEGLPSIKESAMACLQTGQACTFVTSEAIQIHGGLGAALEQDITLYYQRAKAAQLNLGRLSDLEEIIATELNLGQLSDSEEIKTAGLDL